MTAAWGLLLLALGAAYTWRLRWWARGFAREAARSDLSLIHI